MNMLINHLQLMQFFSRGERKSFGSEISDIVPKEASIYGEVTERDCPCHSHGRTP